ncbi:D-serine ammonia-lyase [Pseudomonas frederiksbergensis]|uniref:Probable D-serine dehydratase n=1 Tax=Pseudomonas frederiksbergensis TaxID=104087 RepID=A0A1J0ES99_9PSED|nr:D-serine ammonia-lyase [Pseudomonas frederiksbergensis]APC18977.1 D-serine ammonia-lyase [Pseudomonas frederiksbergensis]
MIAGKMLDDWKTSHPLIKDLVELRETTWFTPVRAPTAEALKDVPLNAHDVADASARLNRFAAYFQSAFPETLPTHGIIESDIQQLPSLRGALDARYGQALPGALWIKKDSHLPISGSVKARGGIYEVLKHAERLALEAGLLTLDGNYEVLDTPQAREFFSQYRIAVGSTGNLGLSIGLMGARLGFQVTVHMSADARQWKKDKLRAHGVTVMEYASDYSIAVAQGRQQAKDDPGCHFVDDENSTDLFLGYAVAAERLNRQLSLAGLKIDAEHPLFVYLPCGVGGGPGGVAFGLKLVFGDAVHCIFAEPTHSPCMFLGVYTGLHDEVSVQDFGIDNITAADGLAVGRASGFVGRTMQRLIDGYYTVSDDELHALLWLTADSEGLNLEPSALAGVPGVARLHAHYAEYLQRSGLSVEAYACATHLIWATGGSMVPEPEMQAYLAQGAQVLQG